MSYNLFLSVTLEEPKPELSITIFCFEIRGIDTWQDKEFFQKFFKKSQKFWKFF